VPPDRPAVEVFTDGCPICQETLDQIRGVLDHSLTIEVYDLRSGWNHPDWLARASRYGVDRVPAIVVNGVLLDWYRHQPIPVAKLRALGEGREPEAPADPPGTEPASA
jgi:hypothetical protein